MVGTDEQRLKQQLLSQSRVKKMELCRAPLDLKLVSVWLVGFGRAFPTLSFGFCA